MIKAKCNVLFLPPYSTDYNPIENVWDNLKNKIRNEGKNFYYLQDIINDFFRGMSGMSMSGMSISGMSIKLTLHNIER